MIQIAMIDDVSKRITDESTPTWRWTNERETDQSNDLCMDDTRVRYRLAYAQRPTFHGGMSNHPEPNIVLRGGLFDGERMHVGSQAPVSLEAESQGFVYRPTAVLDHEFPTLVTGVLGRTEAA